MTRRTEPSETIAALAKSVNDLDASRRVGWAKAFDAQQAKEEADILAAHAQSDRDDLRKMVSFLFGYLTAFSEGIGYSLPAQNVGAYLSFCGTHLVEDAKSRQGREAARLDLEAWTGRDKRIQALATEHRGRHRASRNDRERWLRQLAKDHGFASVNELLADLRDHRRKRRFERKMERLNQEGQE